MDPILFILLIIASVLGPYFWPVVIVILMIYWMGFWNFILLIVAMVAIYVLFYGLEDLLSSPKYRKKTLAGIGIVVGVAVLTTLMFTEVYIPYELDIDLRDEIPNKADSTVVYSYKNYSLDYRSLSDSRAIKRARHFVEERARDWYLTPLSEREEKRPMAYVAYSDTIQRKIKVVIRMSNESLFGGYKLDIFPYEMNKEIEREIRQMLQIPEPPRPEEKAVAADTLATDTLP